VKDGLELAKIIKPIVINVNGEDSEESESENECE